MFFVFFFFFFCLLLTQLSARNTFSDDNLSEYEWIFTKLGMCNDLVEIWFGIANCHITSTLDRVICLRLISIVVSGRLFE